MNVARIIDLWPSAEIFADDIGLRYRSHGRVMKARGRIAREHWPKVIAAAAKRNLPVTSDDLEKAHAPAEAAE